MSDNTKPEVKAQALGKLMIVDDEKTFLMILNRMFSKFYDVVTAENGADALEMLKSGYDAEVILSDQRMPGMTGAEFLEKTMQYVPNATRVILTGYSSPKDIIPAINQAHAYMYLIKPADEMALIQAIKISFDYYRAQQKNKKLVTELKHHANELEHKNELLKKYMAENQEIFTQSVQALSGIANYAERFYYTNHTRNVVMLAKSLGEEYGMKGGELQLIIMGALLHSTLLSGMPLKYLLSDPYDINDEKERGEYFIYFNKTVDILRKIKKLHPLVNIISQIWEHHDGSGYPNGISGTKLTRESQIVAIANYYHNNVYRMSKDDLKTYRSSGKVTQTATDTKIRHEECVKSMYRRASWFDYDLFNTFQDMIKRKQYPALIPEAEDLTIENPDFIPGEYNSKPVQVEENIIGSDQITISQTTGVKMVEKEMAVQSLESGMVTGQTILTKNKMLVVKNETPLDSATIKNLKQLESTGMLESYITILVPVE